MKKFLLLMMGLFIFSLGLFAEIPHSYVTENPDKEVTQTETLKKYKEKAELNLSVTKLNSEEIEGVHDSEQNKIFFTLDNTEHEIQSGDHIYVSEELQEVPSISTTNGRRKINGMLNQKVLKEGTLEYTVTNENNITKIEINYNKFPKEIYIGILDKEYKIKKIFKGNFKLNTNLFALVNSLGTLFNKDFDAIGWGDRAFNEEIFDSKSKYGNKTFIKKVSGTNKIRVGHMQKREGNLHVIIKGYDKNGNLAYTSQELGKLTSYSAETKNWAEINWNITLPDYYLITINAAGHTGDPWHNNSDGDNTIDIAQVLDVKLNDIIRKAEGITNLTIDESYNKEYIKFDSCTIETIKPLFMLNSPTGVTLTSTSGDGLLHLDPNDTLEINGQKHALTSLNLSEQKLNVNNISLSYKVENGKLQLRVDNYGFKTNSPQEINIKITKNKEIKDIMEHKINLTVPYVEKISGESELSIIDGYNNDYMTIKGCTLENPEIISFVTPVTGTIITQVTGKGILKFEAGDILEINGVQSTVNSTGGVNERSENIGGISTSYKAQNGNLQIRIIDYPLNQQSPQMYNIKLYRKGIQVLEHTMKIFVPEIIVDNSKTNLKIRDEYKEEAFNIENLPYNVKGIEYMSGSDRIKVYTPNNYRSIKSKSSRKIDSVNTYFGYLKINGKTIAKKKAKIIEAQTLNLNGVTVDIQKNGDLIISLKNYAKKISKPFELNIESSSITAVEHSYGGSNSNHNGSSDRTVETYHKSNQNIVFYYVPSKVVGNSTLEVKEYYPTPEYIEFNSCTTPDPKPIALENSLRDVKVIQNSGNGLVNLENGDILELNGKEYHIGAGGNLPEQQDTLGEINFKFKVENGKLRLALTSWGVLEPDRILTINAKRETYPIMEHKMTIQSPRRVEGKASLIFNEKYPIRETIRFQGISLTAPSLAGIEPPIPKGVSFQSNDGYGIPFMKEGDILEIITPNQRAIQKYTIDKNNGLNNFVLDLPGTTLSLGVNSGKLRLGLNNWLVNKDSALNLRIVRGVNEICKMNLTLEVPKAPFDIIKNGILDFGKVIQGSKNKKAETSILLDMHRDVSDVKFNLSTENPELINSNGKSLNARNLQAGVHKQGKNRYLVRVIGALDVPSDQELGVYRGSVLLNVTIK